MLLSKGYPDIGWNPCGGEKYLDFLRFAVFVNGRMFSLVWLCFATVCLCYYILSSNLNIILFFAFAV